MVNVGLKADYNGRNSASLAGPGTAIFPFGRCARFAQIRSYRASRPRADVVTEINASVAAGSAWIVMPVRFVAQFIKPMALRGIIHLHVEPDYASRDRVGSCAHRSGGDQSLSVQAAANQFAPCGQRSLVYPSRFVGTRLPICGRASKRPDATPSKPKVVEPRSTE